MPRAVVEQQVQSCCNQRAPASKLAAHLIHPTGAWASTTRLMSTSQVC